MTSLTNFIFDPRAKIFQQRMKNMNDEWEQSRQTQEIALQAKIAVLMNTRA